MLNVKGPEGDLGVIIARFQTPVLTPAHRELIDTVRSRHKKFIIILGVSPVCPSTKNPFDFSTRYQLIQESYPTVAIIPIQDVRSDKMWSDNLDQLIRGIYSYEKVVLYGSRDSFITHYKGKFITVDLEAFGDFASTKARQDAFHDIRSTEDFRRGICYAAANQYRKNILCVDVAVIKQEQVLLGRKNEDGELWRFLGGHVNANETAETTARREASEEAGGIGLGNINYIGSTHIDDWRYSGIDDGIFTMFFAADYQFGQVKGTDDIDIVKWFNFYDLQYTMFVPEHIILYQMFMKYLKGRK
jgi:bifunctional NMN adenylyltransferase/nudix hydrolase